MLRKTLFTVIFIISFSNLFADDYSFIFSTFFGIEKNTTKEDYYYPRKKSSDNYKLMSLLEWNQNPSIFAGVEGTTGYKNNFFKLKCGFKLPGQTGKMYDSDYTETGMKFNYSINSETLVKGLDLSGSLSHAFIFDSFAFEPEFSANWSYFSIEARDGYGWYGGSSHTTDGKTHAWNDPESHFYPDGKLHLAGVDYTNHTVAFFLGINLSKTISGTWENSLGLFLAPFTYIYAKDSHVGKVTYFTTEDMIFNYLKNFRINYRTSFRLNKNINLSFLAQYEWCLLEQGDDYYDGYKNLNDGGASYTKLRFESGIKYKF